MPRARSLKPGFFTNDELAECGPLGMLLFEGLWCHADKSGRIEDRPKRLKAEILPYFDADVDALLDDLAARGFVVRYEANGERLVQVVNFAKHQNPHKNEPASTRPAPGENRVGFPADVAQPVTAPDEHAASTVQAPDMSASDRADSGLRTPDSGLRTPDCCNPPSGAATDTPAEPPPLRNRKEPERPIPEGWQPTEATVAWAAERGFEPGRIRHEAERFTAHALARDRRLARWDQGFRGWLTSGFCAPPGAAAPANGHAAPTGRSPTRTDQIRGELDQLTAIGRGERP